MNKKNVLETKNIPIGFIDDFPNHPFKVMDDEEMYDLVQSIKEYGLITPVVVRQKKDGRYELISGHRRKKACIYAGFEEIRAEVIELDDDEATLYMIDANLQRTKILPSEKAFAYKMQLEAMKRQGARTDLTSVPMAQKLKGKTSRDILGEMVGESQDNVRRYIRLTNLAPELLEIVDNESMALRPAVEISYLPYKLQMELYDCILMEDCTPNHAQAIRMRKLNDEKKLTAEAILGIMREKKPNQKEHISIEKAKLDQYLPKDLPIGKRETFIIDAVKYYCQFLKDPDSLKLHGLHNIK